RPDLPRSDRPGHARGKTGIQCTHRRCRIPWRLGLYRWALLHELRADPSGDPEPDISDTPDPTGRWRDHWCKGEGALLRLDQTVWGCVRTESWRAILRSVDARWEFHGFCIQLDGAARNPGYGSVQSELFLLRHAGGEWVQPEGRDALVCE